MTRLRIPIVVRRTEHLFCAIGGLLAVLANVAFPQDSKNETVTLRDCFGLLIAGASICWIAAAWQLVHRRLSQLWYARIIRILSWLTLIVALGGFYLFVSLGGNTWRAAPGAIFVLVLPFFLRWQTSHLAFWFPAPPAPGMKSESHLNAPRRWDVLLWTFLYMGLWMLLLGV